MISKKYTLWFLLPEAIIGIGLTLSTIAFVLPCSLEKNGCFMIAFVYMLTLSVLRINQKQKNSKLISAPPIYWKWFWRIVILADLIVYMAGAN